jgi:hypothetical protein
MGWTIRVSIPEMDKRFSVHQNVEINSAPPHPTGPRPLLNRYQWFLRGKSDRSVNAGWCELEFVTADLKTLLPLCEHFRINLNLILELFHAASCLLALFLTVLLHYSNFTTVKRGEASTLLMSVSFCVLATFESTCVAQQKLLTFLLPVWIIDGIMVDCRMVQYCLHLLCSVEKVRGRSSP